MSNESDELPEAVADIWPKIRHALQVELLKACEEQDLTAEETGHMAIAGLRLITRVDKKFASSFTISKTQGKPLKS